MTTHAGQVEGRQLRASAPRQAHGQKKCRLRSGTSLDPTVAKTHGGLISAFSLHLVKTARLPLELGRALNRAAEIRLVADYSGDQVTRDKVEWIIEQADCFLKTVQEEFP